MRTERADAVDVPRQDDDTDVPGLRGTGGPLVVDLVAVLLFATVGRRTHAEGISPAGVLGTAWPFLAGIVTGWGAARAWRRPASLSAGVIVWVATVVVGMLLRQVTGAGTAVPFVVVATATLGVLLLGWRALAVAVVPRLRGRRARRDGLSR
jgi:Protein of unknown function (DUF3054)